jgi:flagellar biosynthesis component FlhA
MWSASGGLAPDPATAVHVRARIEAYLHQPVSGGHSIVATAALRPVLAEFFDQTGVRIDVFAYTEIPPDIMLEPAGIIDAPAALAVA